MKQAMKYALSSYGHRLERQPLLWVLIVTILFCSIMFIFFTDMDVGWVFLLFLWIWPLMISDHLRDQIAVGRARLWPGLEAAELTVGLGLIFGWVACITVLRMLWQHEFSLGRISAVLAVSAILFYLNVMRPRWLVSFIVVGVWMLISHSPVEIDWEQMWSEASGATTVMMALLAAAFTVLGVRDLLFGSQEPPVEKVLRVWPESKWKQRLPIPGSAARSRRARIQLRAVGSHPWWLYVWVPYLVAVVFPAIFSQDHEAMDVALVTMATALSCVPLVCMPMVFSNSGLLAHDLLLPASREQYFGELFAVVIRRAARLVLIGDAMLAVGFWIWWPRREELPMLMATLAGSIGWAVLLGGAILGLMKSKLQFKSAAGLGMLVLVVCELFIVATAVSEGGPWVVAGVGVCAAAGGVAIGRAAYRRWLTAELAICVADRNA